MGPLSNVLLVAFSSSLVLVPVDCFVSVLPSAVSSQHRQQRVDSAGLLRMTNDEPSKGGSRNPSDLAWLRNAMDSPSVPEPDGLVLVDSDPGISGFAVDPQRGFVVVMVGGDRATYTVVSPKDKKDVRSSEALCLVQLAGGLDLGTPILPPDILAKLVVEETEESTSARELRSQVKLVRVDVIANTDNQQPPKKQDRSPPVAPPQSTPERDASIESQAPKVLVAVNKLPGLNGEATLEQVKEGLRIHADNSGQLNRDGFMALLETLRNNINAMEPSKVKFVLVVTLNEDTELQIPAPSAVVAVGLPLRYKVDLVVSEECQIEGFDVMEIPSRFPAFRPIKQLLEDARIMDGFIPSMFGKATAPDNDDKM